jgi:hypothetical protein
MSLISLAYFKIIENQSYFDNSWSGPGYNLGSHKLMTHLLASPPGAVSKAPESVDSTYLGRYLRTT